MLDLRVSCVEAPKVTNRASPDPAVVSRPETELPRALQEARADLAAIRAAVAAGSGESIDLGRQYWRMHRRTLRTVLTLLLHQVRGDLLVQLYDIRRQLAEQLPPSGRS